MANDVTTSAPVSRTATEPRVFTAACIVCALAFQGTRGIWDPDEGRYAEATREMMAAGQWMTPMLEGRPHLTKPPGAYWATAAGLEVLGHGEWGARLFLGLAFGLAAWCVRAAGRAMLGDAAGARAGWCYLAMLYPFAAGSVLSTDTFLAAGLAAFVAAVAVAQKSPRPARWYVAAGVALAWALLAKGHVALLSAGAFVAGLCIAGRKLFPGRVPSKAGIVAGVLLAALPLGGWLLWLDSNVEGGLRRVLDEASKHVSDGDHGERGLWFYPAVLLAGIAPWWGLAAGGVRRLRGTPAGTWILIWAGVTLAGYLVTPTKMTLYLLPLAVPVALLAGARAPADPQSPLPGPRWALAAWLAVLCAARGGLALVDDARDMRAVVAAVDAVDPTGTLPVGTLAGADFQGLQFYLGDRARRLETREVRNDRAAGTLEDEVVRRDAERRAWILVTEDGRPEERAVRRVLGDRAAEAGRFTRWRLLRIEPKCE